MHELVRKLDILLFWKKLQLHFSPIILSFISMENVSPYFPCLLFLPYLNKRSCNSIPERDVLFII